MGQRFHPKCQQVYPPCPMEWANILRAFEGYGLGKVCMAGARGGKGGHAPQAKFYFYDLASEALPRGWWDQDFAEAGGYENTYPSIEAVGGHMTTMMWRWTDLPRTRHSQSPQYRYKIARNIQNRCEIAVTPYELQMRSTRK